MALSRGSPRVAVGNHPALWSPDFPRQRSRGIVAAAVRSARPPRHGMRTRPGGYARRHARAHRRRTRRRPRAASELRETYLRPIAERPPTTARGIHHAAFVCKDVEETIRFYQGLLGFPLVELVENRDYAGSSHFFFDLGNRTLLGFFDFPGHDHEPYTETIGALQHLAISVTSGAVRGRQGNDSRTPASTISAPTAAPTTACTSATPTAWASSSTANSSGSSRARSCCSAPTVRRRRILSARARCDRGDHRGRAARRRASAVAVVRPRGITEAVAAVPAAVLIVVLGIVPAHDAWRTAAGDRPDRRLPRRDPGLRSPVRRGRRVRLPRRRRRAGEPGRPAPAARARRRAGRRR